MTAIDSVHILIVDDDVTETGQLHHRLEALGYRCDCLVDATEVVSRIAANNYDAVVLDIMMPTTGGLEILERIRRERSPNELPVIIITDRDATGDIVSAFDLGTNDYITKPINFEVLAARLSNQVRLSDPSRN